jgi:hypothetical protein
VLQRIERMAKKDSEQDAPRRRPAENEKPLVLAPLPAPPCPPDWELGPPTFIGIGTMKSGTSWWSHQLFSHPDVAGAVRKELHYFQHGWNKVFDEDAIRRYHRYFPRPPGMVTGEWTPRYMTDPWTPARLRKAAPEARLLVNLRDPMPRLISNLRHYINRWGPLAPRFLIEAIEQGRYATQLRRVLQHFPRQQVLVLQLENCIEEPERELARTYRFVGLDPDFVPDELHQPRKVARGEPLDLGGELYDAALEIYSEEMKLLAEDWPELDLSRWPSVSDLR